MCAGYICYISTHIESRFVERRVVLVVHRMKSRDVERRVVHVVHRMKSRSVVVVEDVRVVDFQGGEAMSQWYLIHVRGRHE